MNSIGTLLKNITLILVVLLVAFQGANLLLQKAGIAQFTLTESGSMGERYPVGSVSFQVAADIETVRVGDVLTLCNPEVDNRNNRTRCTNATTTPGANVAHRVIDIEDISPDEVSTDLLGTAGIDSDRAATHIITMRGDANNYQDKFEYPVAGKVWRTAAVLPVWFGLVLRYSTNPAIVAPAIGILLLFIAFSMWQNRRRGIEVVSEESTDEELLAYVQQPKAEPIEQLAIALVLIERLIKREQQMSLAVPAIDEGTQDETAIPLFELEEQDDLSAQNETEEAA